MVERFFVVQKALGKLNTSYHYCGTLEEAVAKHKEDPQTKIWEIVDVYNESNELISHVMKSVKVA